MSKNTKLLITVVVSLLILCTVGYLYVNRENPWKTYENKEIGIRFQYPRNYELKEYDKEGAALCEKKSYCDTGRDLEITTPSSSIIEIAETYTKNKKDFQNTKIKDRNAITTSVTETEIKIEIVLIENTNGSIGFSIGYENENDSLYKNFEKIMETLEFI